MSLIKLSMTEICKYICIEYTNCNLKIVFCNDETTIGKGL